MPTTSTSTAAGIVSQADLRDVLRIYNLARKVICDTRRRLRAGTTIEPGEYAASGHGSIPTKNRGSRLNLFGLYVWPTRNGRDQRTEVK